MTTIQRRKVFTALSLATLAVVLSTLYFTKLYQRELPQPANNIGVATEAQDKSAAQFKAECILPNGQKAEGVVSAPNNTNTPENLSIVEIRDPDTNRVIGRFTPDDAQCRFLPG